MGLWRFISTQLIGIDQCFSHWDPRNPTVPQRCVRGSEKWKCVMEVFFFFFFFIFFFYWLYNPGWVLVCSTILFHSCLSSTFALQPAIFFLFRSSSTWSIHLNLGLPTGLVLYGVHSVMLKYYWPSYIRTWGLNFVWPHSTLIISVTDSTQTIHRCLRLVAFWFCSPVRQHSSP